MKGAGTQMTDYTTIRFERRADIGTLTLARPAKLNAQNPLMWQELQDLGRGLSAEETLRCLVVTGEGSSFSAGIDLVEGMAGLLAELADGGPDEQEHGARAAGRRYVQLDTAAVLSRASPLSAVMPTALGCSWRWPATSGSSQRTPGSG